MSGKVTKRKNETKGNRNRGLTFILIVRRPERADESCAMVDERVELGLKKAGKRDIYIVTTIMLRWPSATWIGYSFILPTHYN